MASFLDLGLLDGAGSIFAFLLIFALVYGLLTYVKIFNLSNGLASLVAVSMAIISLLTPSVIQVIKVVTPWYMLLMFLIIIIFMITMIFGGSIGNNITDVKKNMGGYYKTIITWIVVISIIIFISGLGSVFFGGSGSEYSYNSGESSYISVNADGNYITTDGDNVGTDTFLNTFFDPKIIGAILFLGLAGVTVLLMGYSSVK